jgi:hypothetical protein
MSVHERNPNAVRTTFFSATPHASFMIKARMSGRAKKPTKHGENAQSRNMCLSTCKVYRYYIAITSQGFARESRYQDRLE